jgi:DnaJ like chaperone protein
MIASSWYIYTQFIKSREIPLVVDGEDKHFEAFITLLTKISHSDGVITNLEKDVINYTMNSFISIGKKQGMDSVALVALKDNLNNAYRLARRDTEPFIKYALQLYDCSFDLKVQLLKQLISMASIDGYKVRKKMMIYEAVEAIGFDKLKIQKYINDIIGKELESEDELNPYEILGCSLSDTDETIKKIYMKQIKAFHPDYIQGKGLNDEIIKFAEEKLKRFNNAYDEIKKSRK